MKLNMGRIEGLKFTLFSTFSIEALVMYALTDEEGTELSGVVNGLIFLTMMNFALLGLLVLYEHVIKTRHLPTLNHPLPRILLRNKPKL